ncbi:MAG TPA: hypothetical protein VHU79_00820 [Sphingomicrobium sp.]|jgi:hypothetical protein|nr:hypothetical protein [Sphingomicrobium sp.]
MSERSDREAAGPNLQPPVLLVTAAITFVLVVYGMRFGVVLLS